MTRRAGFTMIEVMVALVITGVVALIVYGTVYAGVDTSERITRHSERAEAQVILRELLLDALRHPVEGGGAVMNDTLFYLDDRSSADGLSQDAITFVSRGVTTPHGATGAWNVTVGVAPEGLRLRAEPAQPDRTAPIEAVVPGVIGLDVQVLDRTADAFWLEQWPVTGRLPAAVAMRFITEPAARAMPALVVHAALELVR
jgi:type II secretion system protein J